MRTAIESALRSFVKRPGWTGFLVLTIALGVGINTAMFSVAKHVLIEPLPFVRPEQLVVVYGDILGVCTLEDFNNWKQKDHWFSDLAAIEDSSNRATTDFAVGRLTERVRGAAVTTNFLGLLGVRPLLGRDFVSDDVNVVVVTHRLWGRLFSSDLSAIGSTVTLDRQSYTLIGVLPPSFEFFLDRNLWKDNKVEAVEYFRPLIFERAYLRALQYRSIGRLREGLRPETVREPEGESKGAGIRPDAKSQRRIDHVVRLREEWFGHVEYQIWIIVAAAGLVLLIACVNVAALLLARGVSRTKEIAVRQALGASRLQIIKSLLAESVLFAVLSGLLGCLSAYLATDGLVSLIPSNVPRAAGVRLDWMAVAFALALSAVVGLTSGMIPAFRCSSVRLPVWLAETGRTLGLSTGTRRMWYWLLVGQVALSLVLLTCAALLLQSFSNLRSVNLGFEPAGLVSFRLTFPNQQNTDRPIAEAAAELRDRLSGLPGVEKVGFGNWRPFFGSRGCVYVASFGRRDLAICVPQSRVDEGFIEAVGIPLLKGRKFQKADGPDSPRVAIVSRSLARRIFPGAEAVGQFLEEERRLQVVGVVEDIQDESFRKKAEPAVYTPFCQEPTVRVSFYIRCAETPSTLLPSIRRTVASTFSDLPVQDLTTVTEMGTRALSVERFQATLLCLFAMIAVLLTVVGCYGVISYVAENQTRDIGVRMTLGAGNKRVLLEVTTRGIRPLFLGVPLGLLASFAASRLLTNTLFEIQPLDIVTYLAAASGLLLASLLACLVPARRASRLEPVEALRQE